MLKYEIKPHAKKSASIKIEKAYDYKADYVMRVVRCIKNNLDELNSYRKYYKEGKNPEYKKIIEEILNDIVSDIEELRTYEKVSNYTIL